MTCDEGRVKLSIVASSPETGKLLEEQAHQLKTAMEVKNLELTSLQVRSEAGYSNPNTGFNQGGFEGRAWRAESLFSAVQSHAENTASKPSGYRPSPRFGSFDEIA
jgi:flagellar hook-length control protein FliK